MNSTQGISMASSILTPMILPNNPRSALRVRVGGTGGCLGHLANEGLRKTLKQVIKCSRKSLNVPKSSFDITPLEPCNEASASRRSGDYKPPVWDFDYIQSLKTQYYGERDLMKFSIMKLLVKRMLEAPKEQVDQLEFIDDLQRLGISYHFKNTIKEILTKTYEQNYNSDNDVQIKERDLYNTSLEFRLLRQHGFKVSQDIFDCFKNEKGEFKSSLRDDTKGLIQLYEASYLGTEGENTLDMARQFVLEDDSLHVRSTLEVPLYWRIQRPGSRLSIDEYEKKPNMSPVLLEFAKLEFNIVQAMHQEELKSASRWWNDTCLAEHLPFARDRLVEAYIWTTGFFPEPQYGSSRITIAKVNALITVIDDLYDVYGTLEELQLFTSVIQRWDIEEINKLPNYMQICFLALNNFVDDMSYDILKDQGFVTIPYLRKSWIDLCNAYLQEAKWYSEGYTPSLEEYLNVAWISISAHVILPHIFFLLGNPIDEESVMCMYKYHDIIRWSGLIFRLANDLQTSKDEMERGDVPSGIECYMNETGANRKEAEEYIRYLISDTWKKMNKEITEAQSFFPRNFIRSAEDVGRMALFMYKNGDGHGHQDGDIKDRISSLLFEPIV